MRRISVHDQVWRDRIPGRVTEVAESRVKVGWANHEEWLSPDEVLTNDEYDQQCKDANEALT